MAQALGVTLEENGSLLGAGRLAVLDGPAPAETVLTTGRVGLAHGHDLPLRFLLEGASHSRARTGPCPRAPTRKDEDDVKLSDIYRIAVDAGIEADARDAEEIDRLLAANKKAFDKLDDEDKAFFDTEKLSNPYSDTRICAGDPEREIRGLLVGIDMEVGEVLLADRLRDSGSPIDLVLAHHPEGPGYANLHEVMYMQADLWHEQGVGLGVADNLIAPRAEEVRRRIMPVNHYRAIEAAELLGFASMSCHTPADNSVNAFVQRFLDERAPSTLDDVVKSLREIPEYADAARKGYGPRIVQGSGLGSRGPDGDRYDRRHRRPQGRTREARAAGVDTLVGMHYSEEHHEARERAEAEPRRGRPHLQRHAGHEPDPRPDRGEGTGGHHGLLRDAARGEGLTAAVGLTASTDDLRAGRR